MRYPHATWMKKANGSVELGWHPGRLPRVTQQTPANTYGNTDIPADKTLDVVCLSDLYLGMAQHFQAPRVCSDLSDHP